MQVHEAIEVWQEEGVDDELSSPHQTSQFDNLNALISMDSNHFVVPSTSAISLTTAQEPSLVLNRWFLLIFSRFYRVVVANAIFIYQTTRRENVNQFHLMMFMYGVTFFTESPSTSSNGLPRLSRGQFARSGRTKSEFYRSCLRKRT